MKRKHAADDELLEIVGADANNLRFVDLGLPRRGISALVGASGSGKSSLLADTLAAEGARRRSVFLGVGSDEPQDVGAWLGPLPPTLHVGQRAFRASIRTTVGTATGLLGRLRRLFIRHAVPWADPPGSPVPEPNAAAWTAWLKAHWSAEVVVWAVPVRFDATSGERAVARLREEGVDEVVLRSETDRPAAWEAGRRVALARFKPLDPKVRHIIEARIGDVNAKRDEGKLHRLLERAFRAGAGRVVVELPGCQRSDLQGPFGPRLDAEVHRLHPASSDVFLAPSPHLLSFNAPEHDQSGACGRCHGTGRDVVLLEDALVTNPKLSMHEGAFSLWTEKNYRYVNIQHETIEGLRGIDGFDPDKSWRALPDAARRLVIEGSARPVRDADLRTRRPFGEPRRFDGFRRAIVRRVAEGASSTAARLAHLVAEGACGECGGSRWNRAARALRVGNAGIDEVLAVDFADLPAFLSKRIGAKRTSADTDAVSAIAQHVSAVGLGHLTGDRGMTEISSGESRRLRLAGVLDAGIDELLVLLDEPARGLHDEDVAGLSETIRRMSSRHTLVISDHRAGLMRAVDCVVDLGVDAGPEGGRIRSVGPPKGTDSLATGELERTRLAGKPRDWLEVKQATLHNLRQVDVRIPLGRLTCITGVSGSGKSTFVRGILVPAVAAVLAPGATDVADFDVRGGARYSLSSGTGALTGLVALDQRAPPANRRSLLLTFLGMGDEVREAFAKTPDARRLRLSASDFGLNAGAGRCTACLGLGVVEEAGRIATCSRCGGLRYGPDVLAVSAEGRTLDTVLDTAIGELLGSLPGWLEEQRVLLQAVEDLGLGYVTLGRRVDTLSGGEVQRLRIARVLGRRVDRGVMFVLDEPAAGLHPVDVRRLLAGIDRMLADGANTVVLVEHNTSLIRVADHVVDFGPGGGPHGGRLVAAGPPDKVAGTNTATGRALKLQKQSSRRLARPSPDTSTGPVTESDAARARSQLRRLMGDDVDTEVPRDDEVLQLAVAHDVVAEERRVWEIGGLDHELALLMLDAHASQRSVETERLGKLVAEDDAFEVRIRPFVSEAQTWGRTVPKNLRSPVLRNLDALGLEVSVEDGDDALAVTATGKRLQPGQRSMASVRRAFDQARALGAGYFEVVDRRGRVVGASTERPLDLRRALVGPRHPATAHLLRREPMGRCPVCAGVGAVAELDDALLIGNDRASALEERWFAKEALALLRGIRRSDLVPFLRRVSEEGLAAMDQPFRRLDPEHRNWVLHGFWSRPGHGSFLKPGKDPSEVGSWLRWNGLYRVILDELPRSKDTQWKARVEASKRPRACPSCGGSGLGSTGELFALGTTSLRGMIAGGTVGDLEDAIKSVSKVADPVAQRFERRRRRLLSVVRAIAREARDVALSSTPPREVAKRAVAATVEAFTTMSMVTGT